MTRFRSIVFSFILISLLLTGLLQTTGPAQAQTFQVNPAWTYPETIPGMQDSGLSPVIITDSEGTIHAFNSQPVEGNVSIVYTHWSPQSGWSHLVDILDFPRGSARVYSGVLDQRGWLHLLFWGGNEIDANIYYIKAPAIHADKSTAWSEPVLIGPFAMDPPEVQLALDGSDRLIAIYSSNFRGNGLYTIQSDDFGETWTSPEPLFLTYKNFWWPTALYLYTAPQGQIFATWAVADERGNGKAIYFSRQDPTSHQWPQATLVAKAIEFEADTPSIIKHNGNLILIYHNEYPSTRWMRVSNDDGDTWSQPVRLFEQVGSNGAASLVIDSNNTLHMFFGNRIGDPAIHGAWHSKWLENQWSNPESLVEGQQIPIGEHGEEGFDPSFLQATVVRGNLLFVLWRHDPQAGPTNIWYAHTTVNAPEQLVVPLPTVKIVKPTTTPQPTANSSLSPTPLVSPAENGNTFQLQQASPSRTGAINPSATILIGIAPIALLIFAVAYWKLHSR